MPYETKQKSTRLQKLGIPPDITLYTIPEAAAILNYTAQILKKLLTDRPEHAPAFIWVGGRRMISLQAIRDYLAKNIGYTRQVQAFEAGVKRGKKREKIAKRARKKETEDEEE